MKTYTYQDKQTGEQFNFRAMNWGDAKDVSIRLKCDLLGVKINETPKEEELIQDLIDLMKCHQTDFNRWFNSLGE
jgi:uncharacterized protein YdiU (UPF0061 family)